MHFTSAGDRRESNQSFGPESANANFAIPREDNLEVQTCVNQPMATEIFSCACPHRMKFRLDALVVIVTDTPFCRLSLSTCAAVFGSELLVVMASRR